MTHSNKWKVLTYLKNTIEKNNFTNGLIPFYKERLIYKFTQDILDNKKNNIFYEPNPYVNVYLMYNMSIINEELEKCMIAIYANYFYISEELIDIETINEELMENSELQQEFLKYSKYKLLYNELEKFNNSRYLGIKFTN